MTTDSRDSLIKYIQSKSTDTHIAYRCSQKHYWPYYSVEEMRRGEKEAALDQEPTYLNKNLHKLKVLKHKNFLSVPLISSL